jgi:hypothetical protein
MKTTRSSLRSLAVLALLSSSVMAAQDFFPADTTVLIQHDRLRVPARAPRGRPLNYNTKFYPFTVTTPGLYQMAMASQAREENPGHLEGGVLTASQRSAFERGVHVAQCTLVHFDAAPLWKKPFNPGTYWFAVRTRWTHEGDGKTATYTLRADRIDPAPGLGRLWFWDEFADVTRFVAAKPELRSFAIRVRSDQRLMMNVIKELDHVSSFLIREDQLTAWREGRNLQPVHEFRGFSSQFNMGGLPLGNYYFVSSRGGRAYSAGVMWVNTYRSR